MEIVTVSLELSDAEASRPFIEAAYPEHPSLLDPAHQLDALFGVVNIPNVIWIDEDGLIVRPPDDPARAAGELSATPLFIDDSAALSILEMRAKCRRLQAEKGLGLVVVINQPLYSAIFQKFLPFCLV